MKFTFLGTGSSLGIPVIACDCKVCKSSDKRDKRLRSSLFIQDEDTNIVIDTGPDFRIQMLNNKIHDLDAILYTHQHRDHIAGLDDIRAFNYILNKDIALYAREEIVQALEGEFPYIFTNTGYLGAPRVELNYISDKAFHVQHIKVIPINVQHYKLNALGFRINDVTYIPDVSKIDADEYEKIKGSKVIILDALRKSRHISHLSLEESIEILTDLQPETGYLTHMSHFIGLHTELEKMLPDFIHPAYDGLSFEV